MIKKNNSHEGILYNKILLLSRNIIFYTKFSLNDTFQNRINLIFFHISFLFIKIKHSTNDINYTNFYQKTFNIIFKNIEFNMRELGYGDTAINKNMKLLITTFYNILLNCESYKSMNIQEKKKLLLNYLHINKGSKNTDITGLTDYFDKYHSFCLDLSYVNVLKGNLNFNYN